MYFFSKIVFCVYILVSTDSSTVTDDGRNLQSTPTHARCVPDTTLAPITNLTQQNHTLVLLPEGQNTGGTNTPDTTADGSGTTQNIRNISDTTPKYVSEVSVKFNFYFNFLTQTLVRIFGISTNILNFIILSHKRMQNPTNMLLVGLAVADIGNLIIGLPFNIWNIENSTFFQRKITFPWQVYIYYVLFTFSYGFITAANWLTVSLSVYRYIAVCHPYKASSWCTYGRTKSIIAVVFSLSFLIFIENFFNVKPDYPVPGDPETYRFVPGPLLEPTYVNVVNAIQIGLSSYLPWLCSFCFTIRIIYGLKKNRGNLSHLTKADVAKNKARDEQEQRITIMLISIVCLYLFCSIPTSVRYILRSLMGMDAYYNTGLVTEVFDGVSNFCIALNSAANFINYSSTNRNFRETFMLVFCKKEETKAAEPTDDSSNKMTVSTATLASSSLSTIDKFGTDQHI